MSPARRRLDIVLRVATTTLGLSLGIAACTGIDSTWAGTDWQRLAEEHGRRGRVPEDVVPRPSLAEVPPPPELAGDGPVELSVEQAAVLALRRNRDLRVAQLTPVITGAFELVERGRFDPEVFADLAYGREEAVETARATGEQFSVTGDDRAIGAGLHQTLPTGTEIELGVTQDRTASNRAPEQQAARLGLTVTQSLLRGFGPAVNLGAVRQAELETDVARYELRGFVEVLLADTEVAYWQHLLAARKIAIFERSLAVGRTQAEQVFERIEVGVLAPTEAAAVRSELALREQALIDARSELRSAQLRLSRLMDLPLGTAEERTLVATSEPTLEGVALAHVLDEAGAGDRLELARRLRPELGEARLRLEQNRLETVRTRNGLMPRLDLFVTLGKTGYADTFGESFTQMDERTYDFGVGISLSQAIGRSAAVGAFRASMASREQAAAAVTNLEQLVELDVHLALAELERAHEQIGATATTRRFQEETVRAEQERFQVGTSTTLLVAQAQRDLLEAQIAEVEAVVNFRVALVRLYLAEGSLLERRGVSISGQT